MATGSFEVSRSRSRRWDQEVKSISRDGSDCIGSCHWVFRSTSRSIPTEFESRVVPLDPVALWSKTRSVDVDSRPSWSIPSARPCSMEQWRAKAPAKLASKQLVPGPSFWHSHGSGKGRYGFSEGLIGAAPMRAQTAGPSQPSRSVRKADRQDLDSSLRASSLFIGTLDEEQIRGRHSGPKFSPPAAKKLSALTTAVLTPR
ncbi:DPP7 [Symbiodinium natans]|uniref:DPP7 protein n=1 Tax=Symbiodinium natans TaxID=878477 RepID=A0A812TSW5_9DINO|nr:DPP7 [Symbiodinium natans]